MGSFEQRQTPGEQKRFIQAADYFQHLSEVAMAEFRLKSEAGIMFAASVAANMERSGKFLKEQLQTFRADADTKQAPVQALVMAGRLGEMLLDRSIPKAELFKSYSPITDHDQMGYRRSVALCFLQFVTPQPPDISPADLPWSWQHATVADDIVVSQHELLVEGPRAYKPAELSAFNDQGQTPPPKLFTDIVAARPGSITGRVG